MTTQPTIDMAEVARQSELVHHTMNHLFLGMLVVMIPAFVLAVGWALVRRRWFNGG
jgi:hypothetical protein